MQRLHRIHYESSQDLLRSIRYLKQVCSNPHPHIVQLITVQGSENHIWIVLEYCAGGSLIHLLMSERTLILSACKSILRDVARALEHLNKLGIVHCAVRPSAILLTENGSAKLGSFECARLIGGEPLWQTIRYPMYASPEVFAYQAATSCMDVWSLGCVGYEILMGSAPFNGTVLSDLKDSVCNDEVFLSDSQDEFGDLLLAMLSKNPKMRTPVDRLGDHALLRGSTLPSITRDSSISVGDQDGMLSQVREEEEEEEYEENDDELARKRTGKNDDEESNAQSSDALLLVGSRRRVPTGSDEDASSM